MKNLFIDSNIWLSLYHFTNDDLVQFSKLKDMINKSIRLFLPQQVYDEITRNREAKLKDALKSFDIKAPQFPAFCKDYTEFEETTQAYKNLIQQVTSWKRKIDSDIQNRCLPADVVISEILASVELIPCEKYIDKAYMRYRIGNPPGKDNKYGDAINWECLLDTVPDGEDLYFISADKDYCSELLDGEIKEFLGLEWSKIKNSKICFYKNLIPFLTKNISDIRLEAENEKQKLIKALAKSGNFQSTHSIIALLRLHSGWTEDQIEELCSAAENNSQVSWIIKDPDVFGFYTQILSGLHAEAMSNSATKRVVEELYNSGGQDVHSNANTDTVDMF